MFQTLRQRDFAFLWSAGMISGIGDAALFVALPIYVYQVTHSSFATSGMFLAELAPALVLGSLAGSALVRLVGTLIAGILGGIIGPIALLTALQGGSYLLVGLASFFLLPSDSPA